MKAVSKIFRDAISLGARKPNRGTKRRRLIKSGADSLLEEEAGEEDEDDEDILTA